MNSGMTGRWLRSSVLPTTVEVSYGLALCDFMLISDPIVCQEFDNYGACMR